jgi:peptide-methionine (S)-S-oxide reductase
MNGPDQERVAKAYIVQLEAAHAFSRPIVTRIDPAGPFYPAEQYHQDYLDQHPDAPYIAINDMPKVRALQTLFPQNWQPAAIKVGKLQAEE